MFATYGTRRIGGMKKALPPSYTNYAPPFQPEKVYNDRTSFCLGCPYPRHGLACWDKDSENCLRADMQELEAKWQEKRQRKEANTRLAAAVAV